ncbi:sensor histidine kinase [Actinoplanes friuliensis]|uniref:histidine kinase n=1 Tax=Actinoplanes friuliensis DSM 7358 TaxID=1246995 RepID=U5W3U6_9ACTN|nr:histidine kinase [Actinoplanes friuliensis]AGZ42581.1 two-component system histidine kinase [Actinoplanes friuliensis DSM 7358]
MRAEGDENAALRRQSLLIAVGCVLGDGVPFLLKHSQSPPHPAIWIAGLAILLADLALALPARTAGPVAVVHAVVRVGVAALLFSATGDRDGIGNATGLAVAGYRAGAWVQGRRSWATLAALIAGMTATQAIQGFDATAENILLTLTNTVLPWLLGRHTTGRSGYIAEVRRRAERIQREAEEQRFQADRTLTLAVETERTAIARDLHDTISHHVSAVGVHAAAARLGLQSGLPAHENRTVTSLEQVETSSRAALGDLRRMLDLLHGNDSDGVRQPGLEDLDTLVDGSRSAGLTVDLIMDDALPRSLPKSLNLAAYRIVQEILTNALRHGDGTLDLTLTRTVDAFRITANNTTDPRSGTNAGTGRGLDGIRHRAGLFGGSVTTGPPPDAPGTWRTAITIPLQESR